MIKIKFPARFTFSLHKDIETGEQHVVANICKEKATLDNIKFRNIKSYSWDGKVHFAVISVKDVQTEDELKEHLVMYAKVWGSPQASETTEIPNEVEAEG